MVKQIRIPSDRSYDGTSQMWVQEMTENRLRLGLSAPAIESLGDLAYLTLVPPGTEIKRGDVIGSMESAKMTSEILSPVSGKVVSINEQALVQPHRVSDEPYEDGALLQITPDRWISESNLLLDSDAFASALPEN